MNFSSKNIIFTKIIVPVVMILLSTIKLMQNRERILISLLVMCFSLNSTTINQYLIILTFRSRYFSQVSATKCF